MPSAVPTQMSIAPTEQKSVSTDELTEVDVPWITLVWNDPVNLMSYVTFVFQSYFGYAMAATWPSSTRSSAVSSSG